VFGSAEKNREMFVYWEKEKEKGYPEKGHMAPEGIFWLGL
jgi:hypothetical protein